LLIRLFKRPKEPVKVIIAYLRSFVYGELIVNGALIPRKTARVLKRCIITNSPIAA